MAQFAWKTVQVAALTAGGPDQDITISGIGTPVAVIVEASIVSTAGSGVGHAIMSMGACDGTTQLVGGIRSRDAVTTTDTGRMTWTPGLVLIMNTTANTVNGQAHFKEWITDGVRITWDDFPAGAYLLTVTLIYGTAAQAYVTNLITSGTENDQDVISGVGFDPVIALFWWWRQGFADPATANDTGYLHHGWAVDNEGSVEQIAVGIVDRGARGVAHGWGIRFADTHVLRDITMSAASGITVGARLRVDDFVVGSGGINVTTLDASLTFNCLVLLLKTGGNRVTAKLADVKSATSGSAGADKKITASSPSGSWRPNLARAIGLNQSV